MDKVKGYLHPDREHELPGYIYKALVQYVDKAVPTECFLSAVLENDLLTALLHASEFERRILFEICMFVYNELPSGCHGTPEAVEAWLKGSGLNYIEKREQAKGES